MAFARKELKELGADVVGTGHASTFKWEQIHNVEGGEGQGEMSLAFPWRLWHIDSGLNGGEQAFAFIRCNG